MILAVQLFGRHDSNSAVAFLRGRCEKHDFIETYSSSINFDRTTLARLGLSGRVDSTYRSLIENWFYICKMRVARFHYLWVDSRASARKWFDQFVQ